jgi:HK97 family phage major capsid protein
MSIAVGTGGIPVYLPAGGLSTTGYGTLMGRPVIPIEQCAALGTVGDIILADMSQYWEINKGPVQSASSIHVAFTTDQSAFRATLRDDYRPMWLSALTPFKDTTKTLSPFVTLATRS